MHERFIAEITLATPLIVTKMVGDSLLAGIAYQQHQNWERAINELPIATVNDIPQMSMMLPYTLATKTVQRSTIYRSFMRDIDHDPDMATMLDTMPAKSYLTTSSGPLRNIGSTYAVRDVPKVYFIGCGDIDRIQACLDSVSFIGGQKAKGYGQVASVRVWPIRNPAAEDNPWFGIIGIRNGRNTVLRPVPRRLAPLFPGDLHYILSTETWHNPYHRAWPTAVVEPCMIPPFESGESFPEHEIEANLCRLSQTVAMTR